MTSEPVARVRYFPGQFLRAPDLSAEQAYHVAMRRRHNVGHHTFGIVSGLAVELLDGRPVVEPGMAVDGYGRELILVARTPIDEQAFTARGTDRLQVWIAYRLVHAAPAPPGYASCTNDDTTYRLVEQPVIRYTVPDPDHPDPRRPATVPDGDLDFGPDRTAPDDPLADWPVYLATLTRGPDGDYVVDPDARAYAGLVGEQIRSPSGRTTVQIGAEHETDPFRFAVRVPGVPAPGVPRLAVLTDGTVVVAGDATVLGDVGVGGTLRLDAPPPVPDLTTVHAGQGTLSHLVDDAAHHEMRLEMPSPTPSVDHEVVVGTWTKPTPDADEQFVERLTVGTGGTVTVHGDLVVQGALLDGERRPLQLGDAATAMVTAAFLSGIGGTSAVVDPFSAARPEIRRAPVEDTVAAAAEAVAGDPKSRDDFVAALRAIDPDAADLLRAALVPGS